MSEKKTQKLDINKLQLNQIVWSEYFQAYVKYVGRDFDEDKLFQFMHKDGYCVIIGSEIHEPPSLIKELL